MKEKKPLRNRWLTIRLSEKEEARLRKLSGKTTCRSLSEYGRAVLLKTPVVVRYRNASADDFLEEMIRLKKALQASGTDFHQSVQQLQMMDKTGDLQLWLMRSESQRADLLKKTQAILQKADQIYLQWLQK